MRGLLAIATVALLSFMLQQWIAVAQESARIHQAQGGFLSAPRPTLDPSRSPLTAQPLATIRAELTATAVAALIPPVSTPTAAPARPEVPHAGDPISEPNRLPLIWIGLVCCYVGALLIRLSVRR